MKNTQQSNTPEIANGDDLSLWDIVGFFQKNWKWLIGSVGMGMLAGLAYAFLAQEKYEASASVQMNSVNGSSVETPQALVEKLKLPNFYTDSTYASCGMQDKHDKGSLLVAALKAAVNPYTPTVEIKIRGNTPQQARECLGNIFEDIKTAQGLLAKPALELKNKEISFLEGELNSALKFKASGNTNISNPASDSKFSASVYYLALTVKNNDEIVYLTREIAELKASLEAPKTSDTKLITPIYAPEVKVSPKRGFITVAAMIAGFFIGTIILLLANIWEQQTNIRRARLGKPEAD